VQLTEGNFGDREYMPQDSRLTTGADTHSDVTMSSRRNARQAFPQCSNTGAQNLGFSSWLPAGTVKASVTEGRRARECVRSRPLRPNSGWAAPVAVDRRIFWVNVLATTIIYGKRPGLAIAIRHKASRQSWLKWVGPTDSRLDGAGDVFYLGLIDNQVVVRFRPGGGAP